MASHAALGSGTIHASKTRRVASESLRKAPRVRSRFYNRGPETVRPSEQHRPSRACSCFPCPHSASLLLARPCLPAPFHPPLNRPSTHLFTRVRTTASHSSPPLTSLSPAQEDGGPMSTLLSSLPSALPHAFTWLLQQGRLGASGPHEPSSPEPPPPKPVTVGWSEPLLEPRTLFSPSLDSPLRPLLLLLSLLQLVALLPLLPLLPLVALLVSPVQFTTAVSRIVPAALSRRSRIAAALSHVSKLLRSGVRALLLSSLFLMGAAAMGVRAAPAVAATLTVTSSVSVDPSAILTSSTLVESPATLDSSATVQASPVGARGNKKGRRLKANSFVRLAANRVAPAVVQLEVERRLPRASPQATLRKSEEDRSEEAEKWSSSGSMDGGEGDEFRETDDVMFLARSDPILCCSTCSTCSSADGCCTHLASSSWPHKPRVGAWLRRLKERGRMEAKEKAKANPLEAYTETSV
ncbi:unnamed protein product [Closterium sp. NIES-53]